MSASIVSGMDAAPVFEAGEEVLDLVALSIELGVVTLLDTVLGMWRDARRDAAFFQGMAECYGTVGAVGKQVPRGRQVLSHAQSGWVVASLAFGKTHKQGSSITVAHDMQLSGQSAAAASDTSG